MADNKAKPVNVKPVKSEATDEDYMPPDIKDKLQDMKNKKAAENYEATKRYEKGGDVKADMSQDKKMAKKAVRMHDDQLHGGKKTNLKALKQGGSVGSASKRADGCALRGKTRA